MNYTKEEKETAKALVQNKSYMELLAKIFTEGFDKVNPDVSLAKTNDELGEIVRADVQAEMKIKARFDKLKGMGVEYKGANRQPIE